MSTSHEEEIEDEIMVDSHECDLKETADHNEKNEHESSNQVPTFGNGEVLKPKVGMRFESMEAATLFYKEYGCRNGFSTRTRDTKKRGKTDEITVCVLVLQS
ncbi:hypothetical protein ACHQM5_001487 [Ranunculus cassubicifolius]